MTLYNAFLLLAVRLLFMVVRFYASIQFLASRIRGRR